MKMTLPEMEKIAEGLISDVYRKSRLEPGCRDHIDSIGTESGLAHIYVQRGEGESEHIISMRSYDAVTGKLIAQCRFEGYFGWTARNKPALIKWVKNTIELLEVEYES